MPEHIRALVVILVLVTPVWWIAQRAFSGVLPSGTAARWRNVWYLVTLALFLSHNYWLFAFLLIAVVLAVRRQETQVVGLFFVLLFAGSPVSIEVPGFGLINYVLLLDHYRLLTLALLLPTAMVLIQSRRSAPFGKAPADYLVLAYFLLLSALEFRGTSMTNGARNVVIHVIEVLLPYYVISRSIKSVDDFKVALSGFVIAACLLAPLAVFEAVRGWRIYTSVQGPLGLNPYVWADYLGRAGLLRAGVSLGHPIALGFVFMVGMGFLLFLNRSLAKDWQRWLAWTGLTLGLLCTLSRGPWVGAMVLILAVLITSAKPIKTLLKASIAIAVGISALGLFSGGEKVLALLPFFGTEEAGSVDYRLELWSFVRPVVERHFWLGSENYVYSPELQTLAAIQGEGIPDLVNHYFQIVLAVGVIGLVLFCAILARTLYAVWRDLRRQSSNPELELLGAALFCTLLSVVVTISTVANITAVPVVIWSVLGLCAAYSIFVRTPSQQPASSVNRRGYPLAANNR